MKNPVHPGRIIKSAIADLDLTVTAAAQMLNVSRPTLSTLINGKSGVSPEMAVRLSKAIGSTPAFWLRLQMSYDLAQVEQRADTIVVNLTPAQPTRSHHESR
jgi:addiction module HigA family antidote